MSETQVAATARGGSSATVQATRDRIHEQIRLGAFAATGRLPSERELGASLAVGRTTLRRALVLLAEEGLVSASPKSGWFVNGAPLSEPSRTLVSFTEMARRRGVEPRTHVLSHSMREATIDEASELMTAPLSAVLEIERLRSLGSTPACIDRSVILLSRTPGIESADLEDTSLYEVMRGLGTVPSRSRYAVEAIGADDVDAQLLGVATGSPLLLAAETCHDSVGRPLLLGTTRYRAGIYRFYTTMLRR